MNRAAPGRFTPALSPGAAALAAWRGFWAGFVTPTPAAFGLMLATFALMAAAICMTVTPALVAGPLGAFLPRSTQDAEGFVTREALRLAVNPPEPAPRLRVLGNSVLAHAFASEEGLATALQAATGRVWSVAMLTTPLQGAVDEAALAEHAVARAPALVVLPVAASRFAARSERLIALDRIGRLGLRSDWADEALATVGGTPRARTGIYVIDNRNFLLRNAAATAGRLLTGRPATRRIDVHADRGAPGAHYAERHDRMIGYFSATGRRTDGIALLERVVARLRAGGSTVLLVEEPVSDALFRDAAERALYARHLAWSAATARRLGVGYCRPAATAGVSPRVMRDYVHVTEAATQARLRAALAGCVAAMTARAA